MSKNKPDIKNNNTSRQTNSIAPKPIPKKPDTVKKDEPKTKK